MIAQVARDYVGRVEFLTVPGEDSVQAMARFLEEFEWPDSMTHAVDKDLRLREHFQVRFRGAWIFLNDDGTILFQSVTHIPETQVRANLDKLLSDAPKQEIPRG
ncbi:MAG TPA: hypothetical protein VI541_03315 [Actinomycetota bacterium]|nr:hypothetical protein [Actinomycetota bacterium]